jgi:NADH-quinone oxidoreductase subunit H
MKMGLFLLSEFIEIVVISALVATLFFGGYSLPWLGATGFTWPGGGTWELPHGVVVLLQVLAFATKVFLIGCFQILVRWTLPRFRYDQLMDLGWKYMLPIGLVNILLAAVWLLIDANTMRLYAAIP